MRGVYHYGFRKKTIDDANYCGKKVLVRCDFNVPMKDGVITNENRINAALPTIQKLINDGAKVILCSHLGKPKNGPEAKFSIEPVAAALSAKLGKQVVFANDDTVVGENAKAAVAAMNNGDVVLLQNTRFRKEETKTCLSSLRSWLPWQMHMWMTLSAAAIALTAPLLVSPTTSRIPLLVT